MFRSDSELETESREKRFKKKFEAAPKYIFKEIFPWLPPFTKIEQTGEISKKGYMAQNTIPELYDFTLNNTNDNLRIS